MRVETYARAGSDGSLRVGLPLWNARLGSTARPLAEGDLLLNGHRPGAYRLAGQPARRAGGSSFYDGLYIALAEWLDVTLVTLDARLSGVPGVRIAVDVID